MDFLLFLFITMLWALLTPSAKIKTDFGRRKVTTSTSPHRYAIHPIKPPWVKQEVIRLKALMPTMGCRKIAATFNRLHQTSRNMCVSKSYVANIIRDHQYDIQVVARKIKHQRPNLVPKNLIWGVDLTGKVDTQKTTHTLLGIVEHHSRACLSLQTIVDKSSITLLRHLLNCIEQYGKPKIIRTDNEQIFTSRLFSTILWLLRIKHQTTDLHCPWQNGRVERFFLTLKEKLNHWQVDNGDQLNIALSDFRFWYNHVRPHQYLDDKTPAKVWCGKDVFQLPHNEAYWFETWEGLLTGYYIPT